MDMKKLQRPAVLALVCLALCVILALSDFFGNSFWYDPVAALSCSEANRGVSSSNNARYVMECLHAGGITFRISTIEAVKETLVQAGYARLIPLNILADDSGHALAADNPEVQPGDVMAAYCPVCQLWTNMAFISGVDEQGLLQFDNQNWVQRLEAGKVYHTTSEKTRHDNLEVYALVLDRGLQRHCHDFGITGPLDRSTPRQCENGHPHRYYDVCKTCGFTYFLGAKEEIGLCHLCNPSPDGIPVLTLRATVREGKGAVALSWTAIEGAQAYEVLWAEENRPFEAQESLAAVETVYTGGQAGKVYRFKIRTGDVVSDPVSIVWPLDPADTLPAVLENNGFSALGQPRLKWSPVDNAGQYRVYRREVGTEKWEGYTIEALTFTHVSAEGGKTYEYEVCAVFDENTEGPRSNRVEITARESLPPELTAYALSAEGQPRLRWTAVENGEKYRVYRREVGTESWSSYTIGGQTYTHASAEVGKTYEYEVCAVFGDNEGPRSNRVQITARVEAAPVLSDGGLSANGKPRLTWTAVENAEKYRVYRREVGASQWSTYNLNATEYTHGAAEAGKVYEYMVCAVLADGLEGPRSNTVRITCE